MAETREYFIASDELGDLHISEDVIAVVAATAAAEVEGVAGLFGAQKTENQHGARRTLGHSVRVAMTGGELIISISIIAKLGGLATEIGRSVQAAVRSAVESACGTAPAKVNVQIAAIRQK